MSVNEIAAQAGVGKMTLYRHWPNKASLVMDSLLELISAETAFPEADRAFESLRQQVYLEVAFFRRSRGEPHRFHGCRSTVRFGASNSVPRTPLNPGREGVRQTIEAAIAEGSGGNTGGGVGALRVTSA